MTLKIKEKVKKALNAVKDIVAEGKDLLHDESVMHMEVQKLYNSIENVLDVNKKKLPPQVKEAAEGLLKELREILKEDSKLNAPHLPRHQHALAERTIDIVLKYQANLEAAPGFWNQLKAHLNTFIEAVTGIENAFETEKTEFSKDASFNRFKQNVKNLKEDLETPEEDSTNRPTGGRG